MNKGLFAFAAVFAIVAAGLAYADGGQCDDQGMYGLPSDINDWQVIKNIGYTEVLPPGDMIKFRNCHDRTWEYIGSDPNMPHYFNDTFCPEWEYFPGRCDWVGKGVVANYSYQELDMPNSMYRDCTNVTTAFCENTYASNYKSNITCGLWKHF